MHELYLAIKKQELKDHEIPISDEDRQFHMWRENMNKYAAKSLSIRSEIPAVGRGKPSTDDTVRTASQGCTPQNRFPNQKPVNQVVKMPVSARFYAVCTSVRHFE